MAFNLNINELKEKLRNRGASTRGRKADLIERLDAYRRNDDFKVKDAIFLPAVSIPDWPHDGYKQLSQDHQDLLPEFHMQHIQHYFIHRQMSDEKQSAIGDLKSIEKGRDLLMSKYVDACSFLLNENGLYLTGIVRAAMKKKVSYSYKLKFNLRGEIVNSHCECPGGKGPHGSCKHVAAVCLMLQQFKEKGVLLMTLSCTETLQNFHHPVKKYTGSPVEAEDLEVPSRDHTSLDDPRPMKRRKMAGWPDFVRNQIVNFSYHQKGKKLACSFLWDQADIQTAMLDHNYMQLPFVEYWIDQANKVDDRKRLKIEETTRGQSRCEEWYSERAWRITSSVFGTVTKLTERRNIPKLCRSLMSTARVRTPAILHGLHYESIAIEKFCEVTGFKVKPCGLFVCNDFPFLAATPDGVINDECILEIKCPYTGRNEKITEGKNFPFIFKDLNSNFKLKKNHNYYDQVQGQLFVTNRKWCFFVVYTFCDFRLIRVRIDEDYCSSCIIPKLQCFYTKFYRPFIAQNLYKM